MYMINTKYKIITIIKELKTPLWSTNIHEISATDKCHELNWLNKKGDKCRRLATLDSYK